MSRTRIYANDTERQRAWRERLKAQAAGRAVTLPVPPKGRRPPSRPVRLAAALAVVQQLQGEYECWLEALPDSLAESRLAERLTETIEQFQAACELLQDIELPKGFGRD
jgi:hypothetical protein